MRRWRLRRRRTANSELDITAFMNLMVILVPFLLITAVFSRITVLDLYLPASAEAQAAAKKKFNLEVVIRANGIELADGIGSIRSVPAKAEGYDLSALSQLLQSIKSRFPDEQDATILVEPDIAYDTLVRVMDTVRMVERQQQGQHVFIELFPNISLGDAPVAAVRRGGRAS